MSEPSIFTRIIKGEIPCYKIYEDDKVIAFLDIHPINPGQVLVVPKKQIQYIWDLSENDYQSLMEVVKKIGAHIRRVIGCERVGIVVEGFDVPHCHVKLIPLHSSADLRRSVDSDEPIDQEALAKMAVRLKLK